ncbi:MAG: hypothetical protein ACPLRR_00860, partial [Candidatus Saccharicenans sp.]
SLGFFSNGEKKEKKKKYNFTRKVFAEAFRPGIQSLAFADREVVGSGLSAGRTQGTADISLPN